MSLLGNKDVLHDTILCAIYDAKSETFSNIIPCKNFEVLKRQLKLQILNDPHSLMAQYPGDFSIYTLGSYSTTSGVLFGNLTFYCELSEILSEGGEL